MAFFQILNNVPFEMYIYNNNNSTKTDYIDTKIDIRNRIASVGYVKMEMKLLIPLWVNIVTEDKRSTRLGTTGWEKWSIENCASD